MLVEACEARVLLAGSGFSGTYYNNADLTSPVISRNDSAIDFNWGKGSPDPGVDPSTFSVRWTGYIKPTYGETYTFYATADDGVRLKVNGQTIIDRWTDRASLPGDANNDGVVNFADFQVVEKQLGSTAPQSDFNHDNTVNTADLKLLYANYGKTLATGSPTDIGTSHRPSLILQADLVYVIENGRITEQGPPEDLRNNNAWFTRFLRTTQEGAWMEEDLAR